MYARKKAAAVADVALCAMIALATPASAQNPPAGSPPPWGATTPGAVAPEALPTGPMDATNGTNPMLAPAAAPAATPASPAVLDAPAAAPARGAAHPGESLHLTQKAWDDPRRNIGRGQTAPGYKRLSWTESTILPINSREGLITTVRMPPGETIQQLVVSDPGSIEAVPSPDKRNFVVKPTYPGIDGSIVVFGVSGRSYDFYLQSTTYDSKTLPDVKIDVEAAGGPGGAGGAVDSVPYPGGAVAYGGVGKGPLVPGSTPDDPSAALTAPRAASWRKGRDFAATARTGPGRLRTDLRILVSKPEDTIIAPVAAWRDDKFTYLDFGPRAASMNTWPVAALVVDKVESPVGTRVAGANRSVMVVESLGDIVLRNGEHTVCIKLEAFDEDPRRPAIDEPYRDRPGLVSAPREAIVAAADAGLPPERRVGPSGPATALTGPYPVDKALTLASDIVKGYRGLVTETQIAVVDGDGKVLERADISAAPSGTRVSLRIGTADHALSERVCKDLRYAHRPCRTL